MKVKVKRFIRRTLAIVVGLWLGLVAADVAFNQLPSAAHAAAAAPGSEKTAPHADHADGDHAPASIEALKNVTKGHWSGKVFGYAILLFLAAAIIGPLALKLKSPEPPERDEHHAGAHDDHHHDAHHDAHAAPAAHGGHGH